MINAIRKGFNVRRFHTTARIQEETNGHHSANVAAIALRLSPTCSRDLLISALMHDVAETYTGDVPAPFKWDNNAAALGIAEGELAYINGCNIPCPELTKEEAVILKVADMLDLVLSSIEDLKRGNTYSQALLMNGLSYLDNMEMPDDIRVMADEMIQEVRHAAG